jgi:hypothetical protein
MINVTTKEIEETIFEYKLFLAERSGSFTTYLYKAIHKADAINQYKMAKGFPAQVLVYNLYCTGANANIYYEYKIDGEPLCFRDDREEKILELGAMVYGSVEKTKQAWCLD